MKLLEDNLAEQVQALLDKKTADMFATRAVGPAEPLTVEKLQELFNDHRRQMNCVYVISSNAIPDDAYGVLMLRPEDAEKWRKEKKKGGGRNE